MHSVCVFPVAAVLTMSSEDFFQDVSRNNSSEDMFKDCEPAENSLATEEPGNNVSMCCFIVASFIFVVEC